MTKSACNWDAEEYARHSSAQLQWAEELISKLALRGDEALLDVGCGDGKITARLARLLPEGRVVGLDASADMIRLARDSFAPAAYANLSFVQQDARAISLKGRFDLVFSAAALHWVKEHDEVLQGMRYSLNPGGRILLQMGGSGNAVDVFAALQKVIAAPLWNDYFAGFTVPYHFYGPDDYELWLVQQGFRSERVELVQKDMVQSGRDGFKGWLRSTWFPYTDRLPVALREQFLDEVTASYIADWPLDAAGNTHTRMVRLEVAATLV